MASNNGTGKNKMVNKHLVKFFLITLSMLFVAGCATQEHNPEVKLSESFWQNSKHNITVAKTRYNAGNMNEEILATYNDLPKKFISKFKQRNILAT
jgi:hypothetical protein